MTIDLEELAGWRAETDAHLARLDLVTEEHEQDLRAKRAADNKTLSAIRETQLDHGKKLDVIEVKLDNLGRGQVKLGRDVESLQADMGMVKGRLGKVEDKLTVIAKTQVEHTKAITGLESRMTGVETRLDGVETRLTRVEESLETVKTDMSLMNGKLDQIIDRLK
jgi:chromosome segregation ATPase